MQSEAAAYRPSTGYWHLLYLTGGIRSMQWGSPLNNDPPVIGDFDGDGRCDIVVFRPSTGGWFILSSAMNHQPTLYRCYEWGAAGDIAIP